MSLCRPSQHSKLNEKCVCVCRGWKAIPHRRQYLAEKLASTCQAVWMPGGLGHRPKDFAAACVCSLCRVAATGRCQICSSALMKSCVDPWGDICAGFKAPKPTLISFHVSSFMLFSGARARQTNHIVADCCCHCSSLVKSCWQTLSLRWNEPKRWRNWGGEVLGI